MTRQQHRAPREAPRRPDLPQPLAADWLILTDTDRALAAVGAAVERTCRWQGNAD